MSKSALDDVSYTKVETPSMSTSLTASTVVVASPLIVPTTASTPASWTRTVGSNAPAYTHLSPTRHVTVSLTPGSSLPRPPASTCGTTTRVERRRMIAIPNSRRMNAYGNGE